jgi:hypothetical protein
MEKIMYKSEKYFIYQDDNDDYVLFMKDTNMFVRCDDIIKYEDKEYKVTVSFLNEDLDLFDIYDHTNLDKLSIIIVEINTYNDIIFNIEEFIDMYNSGKITYLNHNLKN